MTLVVPTTEPASLVAVNDQCAAIEAWAETCESIPELQDFGNKLAAIDEYLNRTSTEGRSRVAAAMRRLEVRIGKLLGPPLGPQESGRLQGSGATEPLDRHRRDEFRRMAENEEVVEQVIAESTDRAPASRGKVMQIIRPKKANERDGAKKSRANVIARENEIREMARKGNTSLQMANALDVTRDSVVSIAKRIGVDIPADALRVKTKFDHDRIVATLVHDLEGARFTLDLLDYTELDRDRIEGWVDSLTESIRALNKLKTNLVKESTRER